MLGNNLLSSGNAGGLGQNYILVFSDFAWVTIWKQSGVTIRESISQFYCASLGEGYYPLIIDSTLIITDV